MVRSTFMALLLCLAACGGDTEGAECESADDCDDGQVCAALATCVGGDCPAICGRPCDTDEECGDGEVCAETTGSSPEICQDSRVISDF